MRMKPAKTNLHSLALAAVVFGAVVRALTLLLGRQPPGATAGDAVTAVPVDAQVDDKTATAKSQSDAKAKTDATRRVMNQVINSAVFQGAPVLQ